MEDFMDKVVQINGYDKVKWGASIEEVRNLYPEIEDITAEENKKIDINVFSQKLPNGGIMTARLFFFYEEKLYEVRVFFDEIDNTSENMLLEKFTSKYGQFDDIQKRKYALDSNGEKYVDGVCGYRFYSSELGIIISSETQVVQSTGVSLCHRVVFNYANPTVLKQLNNDVSKKKIEDIDI
jgi:hypothetical protein